MFFYSFFISFLLNFFKMTGETKQPSSDKKGAKKDFFRFLGVASTVGINFVVSTLVGFAIGYFVLDKLFNTSPWFTIIFLILGFAAGFKYLFKIASRVSSKNTDEHR